MHVRSLSLFASILILRRNMISIRKLIAAIIISASVFCTSAFNGKASFINNDECKTLERSLKFLIDKAVRNAMPGVSLAVFKPDCGLIQLVSGLSDLKSRKKMTARDHFRLASCSKPYIGVLVMQLVEEGRVSLDDPIAKYIPDEYVLNIRNADKATIRHLMNHTSGMYDYFDDNFTKTAAVHPGKLYSMKEALKFAYGKPPALSPSGTGYHYSNTNTILLGVIIEKVLQISFTQALRGRIFDPLKLEDTYSDYVDPVIEPLARGYFFNREGRKIDYTDINQGYGLPDGVVVSNAKDMATFIRSLLREERLLKPKTIAEMLVVDEAVGRYEEGLNLFVYSNYRNGNYGKLIGHDGEYAGYKSEMFYFPDRDITIVLLTNSSGSGINKRWKRLFDDIATTVLKSAEAGVLLDVNEFAGVATGRGAADASCCHAVE
jgi:D-alanyl-D-alanine carboxypeptidase